MTLRGLILNPALLLSESVTRLCDPRKYGQFSWTFLPAVKPVGLCFANVTVLVLGGHFVSDLVSVVLAIAVMLTVA